MVACISYFKVFGLAIFCLSMRFALQLSFWNAELAHACPSPVITDMGTELSVPTDMITPTKAFSLLTAYQILAIDGVGRGIWV